MDTTPPEHTTTWYGGLPLARQRPITDEERGILRRMALFCLQRLILAVAATPVVWWIALLLIPRSGEWITLLMIALLVAPAVSLLSARDNVQRWRRLRADLRGGVIWVFERSDISADAPVHQIEILPASQLQWSVDGKRITGWVSAEPGEVADTPEYATIAAQWVEPSLPGDASSPRFNNRGMSPAERDELASHLRRAQRPLFMLALMNAWFITVLVMAISARRWPDSLSFPVFGVMVIYADSQWISRLRVLRRISNDLRAGRIIIVRTPIAQEEDVLSDAVEFLPFSMLLWTQAGKPAGWRMALAARRRKASR